MSASAGGKDVSAQPTGNSERGNGAGPSARGNGSAPGNGTRGNGATGSVTAKDWLASQPRRLYAMLIGRMAKSTVEMATV